MVGSFTATTLADVDLYGSARFRSYYASVDDGVPGADKDKDLEQIKTREQAGNPATLEGCIVRLIDKIAYAGKDTALRDEAPQSDQVHGLLPYSGATVAINPMIPLDAQLAMATGPSRNGATRLAQLPGSIRVSQREFLLRF